MTPHRAACRVVLEAITMLKLIPYLYLLGIVLAMPAQSTGGSKKPPHLDGRIVGGNTTSVAHFPYQISLQHNDKHVCGGSIVNSQWVLTAGHCMLHRLSEYSVRAGSNTPNSNGALYNVSRAIRHANFNSESLDYDIAVIRIDGTFEFGPKVQAIHLAKHRPAPGSKAIVTGWGTTSHGGSLANKLQSVSLPIVSNKACRSYYNDRSITERMLCAGFTSGGKDSCEGDSGGPLVSGGVQVGVVSWGYGCARPNFPGVYSSVANLRAWIVANTAV